jgi:hypothetical protein
MTMREANYTSGPDKTEYIVVRGDSIARISTKTKNPAELIFKANGLGLPVAIA